MYKKKGDPDPEVIPTEEVREERYPPKRRYQKNYDEEQKGEG